MATAKIGSKDVAICYIGKKTITKAYLGTKLVCDSADQVGLLLRYSFSDVKTGRKANP